MPRDRLNYLLGKRGDGLLQVIYRTTKLQKVCENAEAATKEYGEDVAEKIHTRIEQIYSASSVGILLKNRIGGCHSLQGDRKGQYAMVLPKGKRLIFEQENEQIAIVCILEISDHYKK